MIDKDKEALLIGRSIDPSTRILHEKTISIAEFTALHEVWSSDGVHAESIIFLSDDVKDLDDDALRNLCSELTNDIQRNEITVTRGDAHTYLSFRFSFDE